MFHDNKHFFHVLDQVKKVFSQEFLFLCVKPNGNVLFKDAVFLSIITVKKKKGERKVEPKHFFLL